MVPVQVLIVEDEEIVAKDLRLALENLGYGVPAVVSSGEAALAEAASGDVDMVLMDVVLDGDIDGVDTAQQINTRFDVPVVYLAAHADESILKRARATEPFGYVFRPLNERELHCVLQVALRKHWMQGALRESEKQFRALVESTSDWLWATDQNLVYTYASPKVKDLLGYDPQEVIGKTPYDFMAPEEARRVAALISAAVDSSSPIERLENTNLHKNGSTVVLETSGVPILGEKGELLGWAGERSQFYGKK